MLRSVSRRILRILGLSHKYTKREMLTLYRAGLVTIDEAKSLARFSLRHEGVAQKKIERFIGGELDRALKSVKVIGRHAKRKARSSRKKHSRRAVHKKKSKSRRR